MAKVIPLTGTVGFDITAEAVREELKAAKGGPVEFHVNSPGGFVFEGIEIFNLIRAYPGPTEARITGLAASMASYIVIAADKVSAFDNATFMIHNALTIAIGNHNDMRKVANTLESLSDILAKAYAAKTGKTLKEVKNFMDVDSYFFGNEILKEGFIDEILEDPDDKGGDKEKEAAVIKARALIETCNNAMRESNAANTDLDRAVAYVDSMELLLGEQPKADMGAAPSANTDIDDSANIDPAGAGKKKQEDKHMDLKELLAANPGVQAEYDAAMATARTEGGEAVRDSIKATMAKVSPILSSDAYDKPTKDLGVAVITGEKSVEAFDAVVAVVDREIEKAAEAAAQGEEGQGGEETPAGSGGKGAEEAAAYETRKGRLNIGEV